MIAILFSALMIGLLGAGHCLGMCGGITAALSFAIPEDDTSARKRAWILLAYNLGRIASYILIGALAAYITASFSQIVSIPLSLPLARILAGVLLILMGLYVSGIWRVLTQLERVGQQLWRYVQPLSQRLMPVNSIRKALAFGALWGWLPCGLVYTALAYAAAQADTVHGALVMLAFGLGTLPAVLVGGYMAERLAVLLRQHWFKRLSGLLLLIFGVWTILGALQHHQHGEHHGGVHIEHYHHGHH